MDIEILKIIDTAVKIGLGALISGVATYTITKATFSHEEKKELLRRKLDYMESSSEAVNEFLTGLHKLIAAISGIRAEHPDMSSIGVDTAMEFIRERDKIFLSSKKHMSVASSKLRLLGLDSIAETLQNLSDVSNDIRTKVLFEKILPSEDELKEWGDIIAESRNDFYKQLSKEYNA